ncbi:zinc-binding dehydrogenase [Candidatus Poribacteria bacterium]|nr:zinc-binding dehydrogenase [Candidatus Poribacteria bacterium]
MRGVRFLGNSRIEVANLADPKLDQGDVLVKVKASAICGSEMGSYRGPNPMEGNPGHEVMGIIADPNGSKRFRVGDRVGVATIQGCGNCFWCLQGKPDFCKEAKGVNNSHSEFVVSKEIWLHPLPHDIDDATGVLLAGDGLGVPYGASMRSGTMAGDVNCVFGVGPVGLGVTLVQTFLGVRVIAVDVNPIRLELAKEIGAWKTINWAEANDVRSALLELTAGLGPNKCFECSGKQETLDIALTVTIPEGIVMIIGGGKQSIDPQRLVFRKNLRMMGNWVCHFSDFNSMLTMVRNGLQASRIITNRFPLEQADEAYKRFSQGLEGKVILTQ